MRSLCRFVASLLALLLLAANSFRYSIIVLHPSHHVYLDGCAISDASAIETPLGVLNVDVATRRELLNGSGGFTLMECSEDEEEHSGEMQYPFIKCVLDMSGKTDVNVLPIMIGSIRPTQERDFAQHLHKLLEDEGTFFVVSSDFCHWGRRFDFDPYDRCDGWATSWSDE